MAATGILRFKEGLIEQVAAACDLAVASVQKTTTIEAFNSLTFLTPVDTGRARSSWALGIGTPSAFLPPELPKETLDAFKKAKKGGKAPPPLVPPPTFPTEQLSSINGKQPVYITSNLVYMQALEDGHSQAQRPEGMVRVTLTALEIDLQQRLK